MNASYALTGCASLTYSSMLCGNKVICSRLPNLYAIISSPFLSCRILSYKQAAFINLSSIIATQPLDRGIHEVLKTMDSRISSFVVLRRTGRENDNQQHKSNFKISHSLLKGDSFKRIEIATSSRSACGGRDSSQ